MVIIDGKKLIIERRYIAISKLRLNCEIAIDARTERARLFAPT